MWAIDQLLIWECSAILDRADQEPRPWEAPIQRMCEVSLEIRKCLYL